MNYHKLFGLLLFSIVLILFGSNTSNKEKLRNSTSEDFGPEKTSEFHFFLRNSRNNQPIVDYMIYITEPGTGILVTSAKTIPSGKTKIDGLIHGREYLIKVAPIGENSKSGGDSVGQPYIHDSTGEIFLLEIYIERKANHIDVPTVLQYPELPNGCEITSLTAILNSYGMDVSKTIMADRYLPKSVFSTEGGKTFGPNPHIAYAGNPRSLNGGWYAFATPIVKAAEDVITSNKMVLNAENVSGSTREEILSYIDQSIPVIVWVTRDLSPPIKRGGWYIEGTSKFHSSYTNLHTVVLKGWADGKVHLMNPIKGQQIISEDEFFNSYEALGSQAVIIKK